jgi:hypothetical protein
VTTLNPHASFLGLPRELRDDIFDQVLRPFGHGLRLACCKRHSDAFGPPRSSPDFTRFTNGQEEVLGRCATIVKLMRTCRILRNEGRERLHTRFGMGFCMSEDRPERMRVARKGYKILQEPVVANEAGSDREAKSIFRTEIDSVRSAQLTISMAKLSTWSLTGILNILDSADRIESLMESFATSSSLRHLEVRIMDFNDTSHSPGRRRMAERQVMRYLRTIQVIPNHVTLEIRFQGPNNPAPQSTIIGTTSIDLLSMLQRLETGPRNQLSAPLAPLLAEWERYRDQWLAPFSMRPISRRCIQNQSWKRSRRYGRRILMEIGRHFSRQK